MAKHMWVEGTALMIGTIILDCTYVRSIGYFDDADKVHVSRVEADRINHIATSWQEFRTMHDGTQTSPDMWVDPMTGTTADWQDAGELSPYLEGIGYRTPWNCVPALDEIMRARPWDSPSPEQLAKLAELL